MSFPGTGLDLDRAGRPALNTMFGERLMAVRHSLVSAKFFHGLLNADVSPEYRWNLSAGAFTVGKFVVGATSNAHGLVTSAMPAGTLTIRVIHGTFVDESVTERGLTPATGLISLGLHGRAVAAASVMTVNSGTAPTTKIAINSRDSGFYVAGHELEGMQTWAWPDGAVAGIKQLAFLLGNDEDGIAIGYDGAAAWGVVHRVGGIDAAIVVPNIDALDGTGPSKYNRDATKTSIYRATLGYLGAAGFLLEILTDAHRWIPFHFLTSLNASTAAIVRDPHMGVRCEITKAAAGATNVRMLSSSWAINTTAHEEPGHIIVVESTLAHGGLNVESPVVTIENPLIFNGVTNRSPLHILSVSMGSDGGDPYKMRMRPNMVLTGAVFADVMSGQRASRVDIAATVAIADRPSQQSFLIKDKQGAHFDVSEENLIILPGQSWTFTAETFSAGNVTWMIRAREVR